MLERKQLHEYQVRGVQHIINNEFCALFLDMGLGKTVTTLTAIKDLLDNCIISNCLVIAPKKVTQVTWSDEIKAWAHLKDLTISVIDGASPLNSTRQSIGFAQIPDFKGLESEAIVLIDLPTPGSRADLRSLHYVGMSRARAVLSIIPAVIA